MKSMRVDAEWYELSNKATDPVVFPMFCVAPVPSNRSVGVSVPLSLRWMTTQVPGWSVKVPNR
jgi:hypothetical protein